MSEHHVEESHTRVRIKKQIGPKIPETSDEWLEGRRLFVVLELASLETAKTKHGYELLNSEEHSSLLARNNRDVEMYRPDILHQSLLTLLDSPLNKAGLLKIFIHTQKGVLIDVHPKLRIPRTYKRFSGLMVQLLYQFRIRAANTPEKLLKIIKNPITKYLPPASPIIGTSVKGELVDIHEFVNNLATMTNKPNDNSNIEKNIRKEKPIVFVFGAHPKGPVDVDYVQKTIAVSQYPLSSSAAIARVLAAFEKQWQVI